LNVSRRLASIILMGMLLCANACGKKAPPFLPQEQVEAHVVDLSGEQTERGILLRGAIRGLRDPNGIRELDGARVFYARYPIEDPPCEDCPIEYRAHQDLGVEAFTADGFQGELPVQPDPQIYFLKVLLIGKGGALGPASNRVKVVME
jgi:predicted small lipoprotein YifL